MQGVDWEALKQGVGQVPNGINPGDDYGNVSFAAHNDIYGKLFQHLDQLEPGDTFQIQTRTTVYTYTVTETRIVEPNEVDVLEPRQGATATLISCYPYQVDNQADRRFCRPRQLGVFSSVAKKKSTNQPIVAEEPARPEEQFRLDQSQVAPPSPRKTGTPPRSSYSARATARSRANSFGTLGQFRET